MDGATSPTYQCRVFEKDHIMNYDNAQSTPSMSVYSCACGHTQTEYIDCGTGA